MALQLPTARRAALMRGISDLVLPADVSGAFDAGEVVLAMRQPARLTDIGQVHAGSKRVFQGDYAWRSGW